MATLVLSAVGSLVGGPVGGSIGALVGRQIDGAIFGGGGRREGPRLEELKVTTSSYGQPLPRHFGRMRVAGSVIWATDLVEDRETAGGGKGKPKTTTYSYSSSFAVALASRPIAGVGRIWADGELLRGAAGDLKTSGMLRIYRGHGDQASDPLIASAEGAACPAFRNCAYVVFEDLALADFGNRIPALTFEVIADEGPFGLADLVDPLVPGATSSADFESLDGFSYDSGSLRDCVATLSALYPLACRAAGTSLALAATSDGDLPIAILPEAVAGNEDDFGEQTGHARGFAGENHAIFEALRYYDVARDFQAGVQRADGVAVQGPGRSLDFPGALTPDAARRLVTALAQRARRMRETWSWRIAEIDPAVAPGAVVGLAGEPGRWRVAAWEWRERGVELELVKLPPAATAAAAGAAGHPGLPADEPGWPTRLRAFELPWDGSGDPGAPALFAAPSAGGAGWRGAALYAVRNGGLDPIGATGRIRSVSGVLRTPLGTSPALLLERGAVLEVKLPAPDLAFAPASADTLAGGANRVLVGDEIVQFVAASQVGEFTWRLAGLLRGRGGTEGAAWAGHPAGTPATLLDSALVSLAPGVFEGAFDGRGEAALAAIGGADPEPVVAPAENLGATRRPLAPVRPRATIESGGDLALAWTRRARGAWAWRDSVEVPLVEEAERYRIGVGPVDSPLAAWEVTLPALTISASQHASLAATHPGAPVWVRQLGSFAASEPLLLHTLD